MIIYSRDTNSNSHKNVLELEFRDPCGALESSSGQW